MLRIVPLEQPGRETILSLEGRVIGPWVDTLRQSCQLILATGTTLTLDLAGVDFVDRDGVRLLKDLVEGGSVAIVHCSAFVTLQLKAPSAC
jgi:anti-anti-sigma regulatory factor